MFTISIRKLLPFFVWLIVGLVFATQLYLFSSRAGGTMGWKDVLVWELPRWCVWAFLAPIITRLARKFPVRKENAAKRIPLHILLGAVLSFAHLIIFVMIFHQLKLAFGDEGPIFSAFQFAFPLDFHVGIAVYWLMVLLRQNSDAEQRVARLQAELTQAQLQALKMQLHPHFLFNTLNSISSYLRTDVEIADEMIGELGDFLRLTLQNPGSEELVLTKELEFLKRYLAIEQLRFQDSLKAEFEIQPETLDALVPSFILQPMVENAVRHGISKRSGEGIGLIKIAATRNNGELRIVISDNGPGLPAEIREGIGITSTRDRLDRMYGKNARMDLISGPTGGTTVDVRIPFRVPGEVK